MRYVIMADGKGSRWNNFTGIPKHLIKIENETLIERSVRQILELDKAAEIFITSHDKRYEVAGATRYEPKHNDYEIDRFTSELLIDDICFLYGDTYYEDSAMKDIVSYEVKDEKIHFFGNEKSIVAVKISDKDTFKYHFDRVKALFLSGELKSAIGWQIYQSFADLPFGEKVISDHYTVLSNITKDFNTPEDYLK